MRSRMLELWFRERSIVLCFPSIALVVSFLLLISSVVVAISFGCLILLNVAIELFARR
ncbi:hypothetical protein [Microcoleus sp. B3-A4]|uniref:hypothetical protein n=1 Tax=Microcoleus sp. B3-A4 TaxID=2818653 RepID=UPI002FD49C4B